MFSFEHSRVGRACHNHWQCGALFSTIRAALGSWPVTAARDTRPESRCLAEEKNLTMRSPKHHVLVVDDEASIRESLSLLLSSKGYKVSTAKDGFDALLLVEKNLP